MRGRVCFHRRARRRRRAPVPRRDWAFALAFGLPHTRVVSSDGSLAPADEELPFTQRGVAINSGADFDGQKSEVSAQQRPTYRNRFEEVS